MNYKKIKKVNFCVIFFLGLFSFFNPVFSEEAIDSVSEKKIKNKIKIIRDSKNIDEETKISISESYNKTLSYLELIKETDKQIQFYINIQLTAIEKIQQLGLELQKRGDASNIALPDDKILLQNIKDIPIAALEQQLAAESVQYASISAKNTDLTQLISSVSKSLPVIRQELIETEKLLDKKIQDKKLIPKDLSSAKKQAVEWHTDTHIGLLRRQMEKLGKQLESQPVRLELLHVKKSLSDNYLLHSQQQLTLLKNKLKLKRDLEIKQAQALVQLEQTKAQGKHILIQFLAGKNVKLNDTNNGRLKHLSDLESEVDDIHEETKLLKIQQDNTKKKLGISRLNQVIGQVLYEQKKSLPNLKRYKDDIIKKQSIIAQLSLDQIQYQEELYKIKNKETYIAQLLSTITTDNQALIYDDLMELIKTRHSLLDKAIKIDAQYIKAEGDIEYAERLYLKVINEYRLLLDENLFWMRSASILSIKNIENIPGELGFFLNSEKWSIFFNDFIKMINSTFYTPMLIFFVIFFLFKRSAILSTLINTGLKTKNISDDKLSYTFTALFYTLLLAIPIPILFYTISWQLSLIQNASEFTYSIARGMQFIAFPLFYLQFFRFLCFTGGVAEVHFKWSNNIVTGLKDEIRRLILTFLPIIFITGLLVSRSESSINGALSRC